MRARNNLDLKEFNIYDFKLYEAENAHFYGFNFLI